MSNLALPFGIGIVLGIILFFILERVGLLDKWMGTEVSDR
jgi:hypothetical protein